MLNKTNGAPVLSLPQVIFFFCFFFLVTVILSHFYGGLRLPLMHDNQHYFYMSERAASGVSPYTSHFDSKQALSMLITGSAIYFGRMAGISDLTASRIISIMIMSLSIGLVWIVAYQLSSSLNASILSALAMLSYSGYMYHGVMGSRPKVFLVFFILITIFFFNLGKPFITGSCASLAFLSWQPAVILFLLLIFVYVIYPGRWLNIKKAAAGALLALVLYESYFIYTASLTEQLEQTFYFPAVFMIHQFPGVKAAVISLNKVWQGGTRMGIMPFLFLVGEVIFIIDILRRPARLKDFLYDHPGWVYFQLCALTVLVFTIYDHQKYPDVFFILPFFSVMSGWVLDRIIVGISRTVKRKDLQPVLKGLFSAGLIGLVLFGPKHVRINLTLLDQLQLSERVGQLLEEDQSVQAFGCVHLLAFNNAENWTKYGFFFRGVEEYLAHKTGTKVFKPLRDGLRPSIILVSRRSKTPSGMKSWLKRDYSKIDKPIFKKHRITVWKRNDEL